MTCECGYADECDGEYGTLYPLQDGGMCSVVTCKGERRALPPPREPARYGQHDFDDDAVCTKCGFDGAEWWHWKHMTYEGKAQPEAKQPLCTS